MMVVVLLAFSGQSPDQGFYTPFSPQETLNVELIATWSDGDTATTGLSVAEREGYVYLANGQGGLLVLDARWPEDSGVKLSMVVETLNCTGIAVRDTFLYALISAPGYGMVAYSVANPNLPVRLNRKNDSIQQIEFQKGSHAYIYIFDSVLVFTVSDYQPIYFYDLSDPGDPIYLGYQPFPSARQVAFTPPHYLYTASWGAIYILDVSDPADPVCVDSFGVDGGWECIETEGDLLIATSGNVAEAYDISDPLNPVYLHGGVAGWWIHDILMRRNGAGKRLLYTAGDDYFLVYDVTDGSAPIRVGEITWVVPNPTTIFWDRGYTYISNNYYGQELYILHYLGDTIIPPDTGDTSERYLDWVRTVYGPPGLEFSLNKEAMVSFSLFNAAGLRAFEKDLGLLAPGTHTITLPRMRPGVYFLLMRANEEKLYKRIVFTR